METLKSETDLFYDMFPKGTDVKVVAHPRSFPDRWGYNGVVPAEDDKSATYNAFIGKTVKVSSKQHHSIFIYVEDASGNTKGFPYYCLAPVE